MFNNIFTHLVCIASIVGFINGLESVSSCNINGRSGKCLPASKCSSAMPATCSSGKDIFVCCATDNATESGTATASSSTDGCDPLTSVTAPEVGQKSWNKCLEYHERIIRPCVDIILSEGKFRDSKCNRDTLALILEGGVLEDELPHMVLLGYGDDISSMNWLCEGVIISERFILTLALCTRHREYGSVKYIRSGVLNMSDPVDPSRMFKIKRIIKHPLFKPPKPYYNIALLELDSDIPLDLTAVPACIDVGNLPSYTHALALGWNRDRGNSLLQKRHLVEAASFNVCVNPGDRYLYDEATEICYGNMNDKINYYGFEHILQIEHVKCMYIVIGLQQFRRSRSYQGTPFTRVSAFVPWIESIVWP